jgi:Mrp family chromosome partitioning ATPase
MTANISRLINREMAGRLSDPWAHCVTRLVQHCGEQSARMIGLTGHDHGVGTSSLASALARGFQDFGKPSLIIDVSRYPSGQSRTLSDFQDALSLAALNTTPAVIDIGPPTADDPVTAEAFRQALADVMKRGTTVIVDLPPATQTTELMKSPIEFAVTGCDVTYLVCLSGITTRAELANSVDVCRINGLKLSGIVPNDRVLLGSRLLDVG